MKEIFKKIELPKIKAFTGHTDEVCLDDILFSRNDRNMLENDALIASIKFFTKLKQKNEQRQIEST